MALISRKLLAVHPQELGKIKIGGVGKERTSQAGGTFRAPVKLDYFVVTTRNRDPDRNNNFMRDAAIHDRIGSNPKELDAVLMYPEPEDNFHAEMCQYAGRGKDGKIWSCNGETARNLVALTSGPCSKLEGKECKCKPYGRLHVQLLASPYTLGYHVFRTTSWESTNNIQTALEQIRQTFGTCYHAPVKLVVYPSEDKYKGGVSVSHKVGLVLAMPMAEVAHRINEARQYTRLAGSDVRMIAATVRKELDEMDEVEAIDIKDEFFTDVTDADVHAHDTAAALHAPDPEPLRTKSEADRRADPDDDGHWTGAETGPAPDPEPTPTFTVEIPMGPVTEIIVHDDQSDVDQQSIDGRSWSEIAEDTEARPTLAELVESLGFPEPTETTWQLSPVDPETLSIPAAVADMERTADAGTIVRLRSKYFGMLAARAMGDRSDYDAFHKRLKAAGHVTSARHDDWSAQDYRSAIAEITEVPVAGNAGAADDDLFKG